MTATKRTRSTVKPPGKEEVAAICAAWRNRHQMPTSLNELARKFSRCDRTIKRIILAHGMAVPLQRYFRKTHAPAPIRRVTDVELIAHGRNCDTNLAIAKIMEKHHASIRP